MRRRPAVPGEGLRQVLEALDTGVVYHDATGRALFCNRAAAALFDLTPEELCRRWNAAPMDLAEYHPAHEDGSPFRDEDWPAPRMLRAGAAVRIDGLSIATADGKRRWIAAHATPLRAADGAAVTGCITSLADVTAERRTGRRLRLARRAFEALPQAMVVMNRRWRIIAANTAFETITGLAAEDAVGRSALSLWAKYFPEETLHEMQIGLEADGFWEGELAKIHTTGRHYQERLSITAVRDPKGEVENYIAVFADVSDRKSAEDRVHFLANYDPLTELPNRVMLTRLVDFAIADARRKGAMLAVMVLDLDNFKWVNDALGHHMGDQLLLQMAQRIRESVRESDIVARQGGDEFIVVLRGLPDGREAVAVADKLISALSRPVTIDGHKLNLGTSIGISIFPSDGKTMQDLMKNADAAMYEAKRAGRGQYAFYSPVLNAQALSYASIATHLRSALSVEDFDLHFQPLVCARTRRITSFEALIRSKDPSLGMPSSFIPVAERTGLIVELGEWAIVAACRQIRRWLDAGFDPPPVAINVAAAQLRDHNFIYTLEEAAIFARIPHRYLEIELTETSLMERLDDASEVLMWLRQHGIRTAIDDFGTGYSSLAYLQRLPIDCLKIDRSFVMDIMRRPDGSIANDTVARTIVGLAKSLSLEVVAEGVETEDQAAVLSALGCDYLQGYLFGRPKPAAALPEAYHWQPAGETP